ncbi:hypothetical protein Tco_0487871 [Tanacetum coccineum]
MKYSEHKKGKGYISRLLIPSTPLAISYPSTPYPNAYPQPQSVPQIEYTVSIVNQQTHLAEFPHIDSGLAVPVFKQGDDHIDAINKMMSFLSTVVSSRESMIFAEGTSGTKANISGIGGNNSSQQRVVKCFNCQGEEGPVAQTVITHNATYQADDLDAYDSDCDDFSTAKAVLMANLSSYGSDVLSEIRPVLYDGSVIAKETNVILIAGSLKRTLMLEEESRSKMLLKQSDPMVLEKKVNIKPINYAELNRLSEDFGKRFVPQHELSDEQALHPNTDQSASSSVKIKAPRELPSTAITLLVLPVRVSTVSREDEFHDDNPPPPPPVTPTQQAPHTLSTIKLHILKKARERERKARTTLLMAIPEDHLAKFYKMTDAKEMWEAIKSRFGGNDEFKKMQKYILKQQFEIFSVSNSEGLYKGYDKFQSLLSQLEIHGAFVSTEDANQKFLRVFESDIKGSTASSFSTQNVAFVSSESTNSTNDVSTAYGVSTSSGHNSQKEGPSSYTDELKYSFFANQSSRPQLDHEYLEQFYQDEGRRCSLMQSETRSKGNQESRRRDARNTGYKAKDNGRRPRKQEEPKALVTLDGEGSDTKVTSCSKECVESYAKLKKLYDEQREQLGDASIEIQAYTQALKKVEAQLVAHQKNQLWYEEKIRFMKIDLDDKTDVLTYHKKLLAEAMSTRDKSRVGYGNQVHEGVLSYENEVFQSVFDSRSSDAEDSHVHDRFVNVEGMHAVPPPMTGNYMPPRLDRESRESNSSVETLESVPEPVVVKPKVVSQPKVWSDAPIIEEYESDSDDEYVIQPSKEQEKPSFAFVNTVKHVKTPGETVKEQNTYSPSPKADKRDWNGLMSKRLGLGYGFTKNACFVCGSFSHFIRDCDFHEKRMAKQVELNKKKGKGTGQGENRPVWNNMQRLNHQNKFGRKAILTKIGIFPVNTARQNLFSQATTTSTARKVNTARPIVNKIRPRNNFYKSHSPIRSIVNEIRLRKKMKQTFISLHSTYS